MKNNPMNVRNTPYFGLSHTFQDFVNIVSMCDWPYLRALEHSTLDRLCDCFLSPPLRLALLEVGIMLVPVTLHVALNDVFSTNLAHYCLLHLFSGIRHRL